MTACCRTEVAAGVISVEKTEGVEVDTVVKFGDPNLNSHVEKFVMTTETATMAFISHTVILGLEVNNIGLGSYHERQ